MNEVIIDCYIHIFLIFPILIYLGITILLQKQYKTFGFFIISAFLLLLILHIHDFYLLGKRALTGQPFNKSFGILLIIIAIIVLGMNTYKLIKNKKTII